MATNHISWPVSEPIIFVVRNRQSQSWRFRIWTNQISQLSFAILSFATANHNRGGFGYRPIKSGKWPLEVGGQNQRKSPPLEVSSVPNQVFFLNKKLKYRRVPWGRWCRITLIWCRIAPILCRIALCAAILHCNCSATTPKYRGTLQH